MKLYGGDHWSGYKPSEATVKQSLIVNLICDMGYADYADERLGNNFNSKTSYYFINEFLDELEERVKGVTVQDEECDPHALYVDIYIDDEYMYTVKNIYEEQVYIDDNVSKYDLLDYEFIEDYQSSSVSNAVNISGLFFR